MNETLSQHDDQPPFDLNIEEVLDHWENEHGVRRYLLRHMR
jgi:hypothetical protein